MDFGERVETLGEPGLDEGGQGNAGGGTLGRPGTATNLARDDQRAHRPFRRMVVRRDPRRGEKGEEFALMNVPNEPTKKLPGSETYYIARLIVSYLDRAVSKS